VVAGIHDVFGPLFREWGFAQILNNPSQSQILHDCVLARVAQPLSKHRTAALLEQDFAISIPLDRIYRKGNVVRNELLRVQASILKDKTTGARYRLPFAMTQAATEIHRTFGLKRSLSPTPIGP
jgi:hypothetical protein